MDLLGHYLQDRQQKIRKTTDGIRSEIYEQLDCCLLYTSDAADE